MGEDRGEEVDVAAAERPGWGEGEEEEGELEPATTADKASHRVDMATDKQSTMAAATALIPIADQDSALVTTTAATTTTALTPMQDKDSAITTTATPTAIALTATADQDLGEAGSTVTGREDMETAKDLMAATALDMETTMESMAATALDMETALDSAIATDTATDMATAATG